VALRLTGADAGDTDEPSNTVLLHPHQQHARRVGEQCSVADIAGAEGVDHSILSADGLLNGVSIKNVAFHNRKTTGEVPELLWRPDQRSHLMPTFHGVVDDEPTDATRGAEY
jgi:hypothetical protein